MPFNRLGAVAAAVALASLGFSARADVTGTYQSFVAGGPVTVGNATYSNFKFDGGTVDASQILVDISSPDAVSSKITFTAPPSGWTTASDALKNGSSHLEYDVSFAVPISVVGLDFGATGSAGALASVGE